MLYKAKENGDLGVKACKVIGDNIYKIIRFKFEGEQEVIKEGL